MLTKIKTCGIIGIDGYVIQVETDIYNGFPNFDIVGLGDISVKESKERIRSAIKNSGYKFPVKRITVNLAPASIKKEGTSYDLPLAMGILASSETIKLDDIDNYMFSGEVALDGEIRPVIGILPIAVCAKKSGIENLVIPYDNAVEASVVDGLNILPVKTLKQVIEHINGIEKITPYQKDIDSDLEVPCFNIPDFSDVQGQDNVKRALEIAASGNHNILMIGSPGSGKTMLAKRLPSILPELTFEESIEVMKIYSIAGLLKNNSSIITKRPFRSPHHSISSIGITGGGRYPKPGEVSLAHNGVLFLDEVPEFTKSALEVLRQPLEDGIVTITRSNLSITYPAKTMLVLSANPCKCGYYYDKRRNCTCSPKDVKKYMSKLSGPLLDRIDLHIEVMPVEYKDLYSTTSSESSSEIAKRVKRIRQIQYERYRKYNITTNSQLTPKLIKKFCVLDNKSKTLLENAFYKMGLSARAHDRILKVARTIADMDNCDDLKSCHIAEAIQYRNLDRN